MGKLTISMPDQMSEYVARRIASGQYGNISEYFRDLVRKDQEHQDRKAALTKALIEGERSGVSPRDVDDIWNEMKARRGLDV